VIGEEGWEYFWILDSDCRRKVSDELCKYVMNDISALGISESENMRSKFRLTGKEFPTFQEDVTWGGEFKLVGM